MGSPEGRLVELLGAVKSRMPRRGEHSPPPAPKAAAAADVPQAQPHDLSRDFWMPDQSCRVCYDCDAQFTILNRRHHCRHCGRVFCARCTANSVPRSLGDAAREDIERIRVCNYCFKRWLEEEAAARRDVAQPSSPSPSATSAGSEKSCSTGRSSTVTNGQLLSYANASFTHSASRSVGSEGNCGELDASLELQHAVMEPDGAMEHAAYVDNSPDPFNFCLNRSDDEDDDYTIFRSDSEVHHLQNSDEYNGPMCFDDHQVICNDAAKDSASPRKDTATLVNSEGMDKTGDHIIGNAEECNARSSSLYGMEVLENELVDFENNSSLWLPPEAEDEEDDHDGAPCDDDEGEDATGEWGYLRSNSFSSGHCRNRDKSSEEHKKAMKDIVDGHFRALVAQLLQAEKIELGDKIGNESWLDIVTSLSWEAASLLRPDTSKGGRMDPGGYVKVKCLACGRPSDSLVVRGVVCKKNVAHRRMSTKKEKPRILILGGALEYQRVSNLLSSFDTLLQQETDYLKMAVVKIKAHQPSVVLVEKSVSRYAQDLFLEKNISLVLNIKRPLLERISRCTGAQIVPSIDYLSSQKLGNCDLFHVEKYIEEHGTAGEGGKKMLKTLMFFEGCPKPLGFTILLKGANGDELKKVKHVVQYGVFAAYHLALETSFLVDEGATLPELPLKSPIIVALPDKPSSADRSISMIPILQMATISSPNNNLQAFDIQKDDFTFNGFRMMDQMAAASFPDNKCWERLGVGSTQASSVQINDQTGDIGCLLGMDPQSYNDPLVQQSRISFCQCPACTRDVGSKMKFEELQPETNVLSVLSAHPANLVAAESDLSFAHNANNGAKVAAKPSVPPNLQVSYNNGGSNDGSIVKRDEIPASPADNQSILVSLSSRCVWKEAICERPHLLRIKYYGNFDKPLGRFLRDQLFDQSNCCLSCELAPEAHVYCYVHPQGSLTISVRKLIVKLPGEHDGKIWMWHRCLRCPRDKGLPPATKRVVMSDAAWGLSFGKFLELSFSNHAAASRVASCGHSLHRDCLRFYGFGEMVACFRYASIKVHSVYLPPSKLDFTSQHQEWVEQEANEVVDSAELLFTEVLNALHQISEKRPITGSFDGNMKILELRQNIVELEDILQAEKVDFTESLKNLLKKEIRKGQLFIDILEVNKLRRQLLFLCYLWDQRLSFIATSGGKYCAALGSLRVGSNNSEINDRSADTNTNTKLEKNSKGTDSNALHAGDEGTNQHDQSNETCSRNTEELNGAEDTIVEINHANSANVRDHLDHQGSIIGVRRVSSEGQFPVATDISDKLDAKWRGEDGPAPDASLVKPLALLEGTAADVKKQAKAVPRHTSASVRSGDTVEDLLSCLKMPYMTFYNSLNTNSGTAPTFGTLADYNPVYISLFRDLSQQGGARLFLPTGANDVVIPVFDDEPTSIISYALVSPVYHFHMSVESNQNKDSADSTLSLPVYDSGNFNLFHLFEDFGSSDDFAASISSSRGSFAPDLLHSRLSFQDGGPLGKVKYTVTCYYAKSFEELRRSCCPSELDYLRSISRCKKWGAQGGKSNVFFAKSLDDRFIIKQVTKTELESFLQFGPDYFKYLSESISTGSPTCLAKILGIYQVTIKHLKGGKESKMDLLVMENLLFGRNITRLYDLKGSSRSRYNADSSRNKVLLDQNLIEAMPKSPIFVGNKAKRLLERAVWNDTSFLAGIDVMDYSLLVGVDEEKHELVLGIIDFMRQYTWDKHLETWVKSSGILGGPKNAAPTVVSPMQYKKRFRKAMSAYFIVIPEQWMPAIINPDQSLSNICEDDSQNASPE
ncbi:1-phosphatidylinositol-3-phosphate 5-kinase FAB1B isoform X2 [Aegilops tauschii subsp. strangulata]|uniref:1-phosphatidylinositol-3-phosphate 5-kinase n=7 Tax=Triticinae TaxID=1648030 RepID=A0A453RVR5_AEGTS|nr:1-phosphatidylinositol-3-phosphate 5-kinase FAB1B isoform X1 [Aegilops tauschii subsp. strangulata]XP_044441184.1 1-phosphatidylinositol-3-phosphate 5-kinase FAB1B-like isoform X1 [Triticum aestivum]